MPVIIRKSGIEGAGKVLSPIEFIDEEKDLQEVLFSNPDLLKKITDLPIKSVCNPLILDSGSLDLFLIDSAGLPIAVEAKLKKNPESHRKVIGQLLDYISSLSKLNFEKINSLTHGMLQNVALDFFKNIDSKTTLDQLLKDLITKFDSNLNSCTIRGIIAIDSAPLDLLKTFRYLNDHSSIDFRLVTVQRNRVSPSDDQVMSGEYDIYCSEFPIYNEYLVSNQVRPFFKCVIQEFEEMKVTGLNTIPGYSKGKIENWHIKSRDLPDNVYYELSDWNERVSIEIQVNNSDIPKIYDLVKNFEDLVSKKLENPSHEWKCVKKFCRLMFYYGNDSSPDKIAKDMCILIDETHAILKNAVSDPK